MLRATGPKLATGHGTGGVIRIPPGLFGMALGLAGVAALWSFAAASFGGPAAVGDVLGVLAAVVWVGLMVAYLRQGPRRILADARDAAHSPFLAAPAMGAYVLAAGVLEPHAPGAARAIVIAFLVIGLLVTGLLVGQWMTGNLDETTFGPAFLLPGVGIGCVGADAAATVGLHGVAELFFGIGITSMALFASLTLNRLFIGPRLAPLLLPTMAIELAPAAVAGNAYFLIHPGPPDQLLYTLSGYAALMVIAQLRLLPLYRTLSFAPGFWAFTFPPVNMTLFALRWLELEHPAGSRAYAWFLIAAATILVGAIATRTILAVARGQFLPSPNGAAPRPSPAAAPAPGAA
jgi:tellurite resistance protein